MFIEVPLSIDVAMFGLTANPTRPVVSPAVARVSLEDLDLRRGAIGGVRDLGGSRSCFNFYLMSALADDETVPDDAIDAIKVTLGRAFRSNNKVIHALRQLCRLSLDRPNRHSTWALVEARGDHLNVRPTHDALSHDFLSVDFDHWPAMPATHRVSMPSDLRILVEYVTADAATRESIDADWDQFAARLASYVDANMPRPEIHAAHHTQLPAASPSPRDAILLASLTAADAARRSNTHAEDAASWASRERKAGRIFGVWSSQERAFVHPEFQFTGDQVHPCLFELLRVLKHKAGFNPAISDKGGWARAYWLYQPRAELSARALAATKIDLDDPVTAALTLMMVSDDRPRSPAEAFAQEPQAVIELAQALADEGGPGND